MNANLYSLAYRIFYKAFVLMFFCNLNFYISNAQTINVCTNFCNTNLQDPISGLTISSTPENVIYGKNGTTDVFKDVKYKKNRCPEDPPGATYCDPDAEAILKYDVYYPTNHDYANCKLPAVILFHGGSYDECSDYKNPGIVKLCQGFAKRGFVAFSVEYRRGVLVDRDPVPGVIPLITYTAAQQMLAIYRGCQDARGAIRSIIKRQNDNLNVNYQINVNRIFIGGVSAGSLLALATAYYQTQAQFDAVFPGVSTVLGSIDRNFYQISDPNSNFYSSIKGVFNCWGGLTIPTANESNPYSFFSSNPKKIPIISFHGLEDDIFDFQKQDIYFSASSSTTFYSEKHCLLNSNDTYTVPGTTTDRDLVTLGSQNIYEMFHAQNIASEFYLDCNMMHGLDDDCVSCVVNGPKNFYKTGSMCSACTFDSDFGTSLAKSDLVYEYMVGRGATFFQAIIGGVANLLTGDSKFVDCQNYRITCNTADNNANCNDTDVCQ